ncbi:LysR family transcriptional regulator [Pantoea ananatis]|uniref:LysR family transcriptional regulator n=1 Tax=Pantoea ananas TaxID=553 RepID=UPI0003FEF545
MMNLLHWRLIVAVADSGNITRAAEQTGMTQSGASQAIAQLEASLGFRMFIRERRHTSVTALGEEVIGHARLMVSRLDAIRALADDERGLKDARIRIASFPTVTSTFLPSLLREFKRLHPGINVVVLEGTDHEVEEWLSKDTVDLGVVMNPLPGYCDLLLGRDEWVAVLPAGHAHSRQAALSGISLEVLTSLPFILATGGCAVNPKSLAEQAGLQISDIRITVRDWISACMLVRENMGVALIPQSALPADLHGLSVITVTPRIYREFGLICSSLGRSSPAVQTLLESLFNRAGTTLKYEI